MAQILDLQAYNELSIPIKWVDGSLVKVNQPTLKIMKKITAVDESDIGAMEVAVLDILNNNSSARKFTKKDTEILNITQFMSIVEAVVHFKEEVDQDPN